MPPATPSHSSEARTKAFSLLHVQRDACPVMLQLWHWSTVPGQRLLCSHHVGTAGPSSPTVRSAIRNVDAAPPGISSCSFLLKWATSWVMSPGGQVGASLTRLVPRPAPQVAISGCQERTPFVWSWAERQRLRK